MPKFVFEDLTDKVPEDLRPWFLIGAKWRLDGKSYTDLYQKIACMAERKGTFKFCGTQFDKYDKKTEQILLYASHGYNLAITTEELQRIEKEVWSKIPEDVRKAFFE